MKKYIKPSIEVIEYSLIDVISVSPADEGEGPDGGSPGSNGNGGIGLDGDWGGAAATSLDDYLSW